MRKIVMVIALALLASLTASCTATWLNDKSSIDPQVEYGGNYRVTTGASHGVNQ